MSKHVNEKFIDCLGIMFDHLTIDEVVEVLSGEDHRAHGRTGYEAARLWVLEGANQSIQHNVIEQGGSVSSYDRAVRRICDDYPDWLARTFIESERERWEGGLELTERQASMLVTLNHIELERFDNDLQKIQRIIDDTFELVVTFDADYDFYRELARMFVDAHDDE